MAVYLIAYNMGGDNEKFAAVDKAVKGCSFNDTWMYYIDNTWLIKSKMSADEIGKKIYSTVQGESSFVVIEVSNNFAGHLPTDAFNFMYNTLFKQ